MMSNILKNPITYILRSDATIGIKIIALSLLLVLTCAAPLMLYVFFGPENDIPMALAWLFAIGALISHFGFAVGLILSIWDMFFKKK